MRRDLVIIGAGPAGMSAALLAAELHIDTVVIDEQPRAGGQIYRNVGQASPRMQGILGQDYLSGRPMVEAFTRAGIERCFQTSVWNITRDLAVFVREGDAAKKIDARQVIAATGAMERPTPVAGWTLPGVMHAGAAQIALKSGGAIPQGRVILAGAGPLLLLVAVQLLAAGADVRAVIDTSEGHAARAFVRYGPAFLRQPSYLRKGLQLLMALRRSKVPVFHRAQLLGVIGKAQAEGVRFGVAGKVRQLAGDTILLHHGVVPNQQITRLMEVEHVWSDQQLAWHVETDMHGETSTTGFRVAGDGAAIVGAQAAAASGALSALGAAHALGRLSDTELERRSLPYQAALHRHRQVRPFLDALYRPAKGILTPDDDVLVCRCEEVSAGTIRKMADIGCIGPNQTKFFSRCGMGPCQGRQCGAVVSQILADHLHLPVQQVGAYRVRAPLKPLPLSALASLSEE
jgi:NADPH-dependent 2,4-dienoyl-CoA reductase/sulfur reductase-like enzyme